MDLGLETLDRGQALLDFETDHRRVAGYAIERFSPDAKALLGDLDVQPDTYIGYQLIRAGNFLASYSELMDNSTLLLESVATYRAAFELRRGPWIRSTVDTFNSLLDTSLRLATFAGGATAGVGISVVNTITGSAQLIWDVGRGIYALATAPAETIEGVATAVRNLPLLYEHALRALENAPATFANMSDFEKGRIVGEVTTDIVTAFITMGAAKAGQVSAMMQDGIRLAARQTSEEMAGAIAGRAKLLAAAPEFVPAAAKYDADTLRLYERLASPPDRWVKQLADYAKAEGMTIGQATHVADFHGGATKIMAKSSWDEFHSEMPEIWGYNNRKGIAVPESFWARKDQIDKILAEAGGDRKKLAKALGFDEKHFFDENGAPLPIVRVDVPLDFGKRPRLASGLEGGANEFYTPGGYTAGGVQEIVMDRVANPGIAPLVIP